MSAIDTFEHAHVAKFFDLPIYWVLEERSLDTLTDRVDDSEFVINKHYLSIGGGSGEHPALIIQNDAVVYNLIRKLVDDEVEPDSYDYKLIDFAVCLQEKMIDDDDIHALSCWRIDQNEWPLETFIRVNSLFGDKSTLPLADKICHAMAMFIIYEMPLEDCLKNPDIIEIAKMIRSNQWERAVPVEVVECFGAVRGLMDCEKMGKVIRDGQVVWGYSLSDWRRENSKEVI